ncbi:MAG: hypothetical protein ACKVS6_05650 [Planctomycetota bacterium]
MDTFAHSTQSSGTRSRAHWFVILPILLFGILISILHPIGDAPDESENLLYIRLVAEEWRKPVPEDRIRQNMHPPLSFVINAMATVPLEAISHYLPAKITWPYGRRITIPLNQPSKITMRDASFVVRDGPPEFSAFTLLGLRFLATLFVAIAGYFTYRTALLFLPQWPRLCAAAAAFLLLTPGAVLQTGAIGMEASLLMFGAWGAFELARGLRPEYKYSPFRAGLAFALAGLCRHAGFTLVIAAIPIAIARARRVGKVRAIVELCILGTIAACGLGSWILHNWITTGDPLVLYVNVAHFPEVFRTTPPTVASQDLWLPTIVTDFFGVRVPGLAPMHTLELLFVALLGAGAIGGVVAGWRNSNNINTDGVTPRARLAFGLFTFAAVAAIPFLGNVHFYQTHGRYLLPSVPFIVPLIAGGFRHIFLASRDRFGFLTIAALPAFATALMLLFSLAPMFFPSATKGTGSAAYADCGGPNDPFRTRGFRMPPQADNLFPGTVNTYVFDTDSIEYTFPIQGDGEGLWVHLVIPGVTESSKVFSKVSYVYLSARISIGDTIVANWITPTIEPTRVSYPVPPGSVRDGKLIIRVDRVPRLDFILLAEIEINHKPPRDLYELGPKLRVAAADARDGEGEQMGASYARSYYIRHVPKGGPADKIISQTPRSLFFPGKYIFRAHVATVEGADGAPAALMIAGDTTEAVLQTLPIMIETNKLGKTLRPYLIHFTVPEGPPVELTCRIETTGLAVVDVDDLEVFGPLAGEFIDKYK